MLWKETKEQRKKETQTKPRPRDYYMTTSLPNVLQEPLCQNEQCVYFSKNVWQRVSSVRSWGTVSSASPQSLAMASQAPPERSALLPLQFYSVGLLYSNKTRPTELVPHLLLRTETAS